MKQTNAATRENVTTHRRRAGRARFVFTSLLTLSLLAAAWAASNLLVANASRHSTATRFSPAAPPVAFGTTTTVTNTNDSGPGA